MPACGVAVPSPSSPVAGAGERSSLRVPAIAWQQPSSDLSPSRRVSQASAACAGRDSSRRPSRNSAASPSSPSSVASSCPSSQGGRHYLALPSSPSSRRPSAESCGARSAATAGSALSYAKCKLELERLRAGGHRGPPSHREALSRPPASRPRPPELVAPEHFFPVPDSLEVPAATPGKAPQPARGPCDDSADAGPAGPCGDLPSTPDGNSPTFGPPDMDCDPHALTAFVTSPLRRPSQAPWGRLAASPAAPVRKVSAVLDEEDLAVPWRDTERLTKLTSTMLRMGLQYAVSGGNTPPSPPSPMSPLARCLRLDWPSSFEDLAEAGNPRLQAVRRHEAQRLQELQDRIERRDQRREVARQQAEDQRRREVEALRAAMWLTIVQLHTRSLPRRLAVQSQASSMTRLLLPLWRRYVFRAKQRRARQQAVAEAACSVPCLTPEMLRTTGPLFHQWPDAVLADFAAELQLSAFGAGEYVCHQGDPSTLLYVLAAGTVDVVLRRADAVGKARGKRTGVTVAQLTAVRYVGEYGVFADEPRAATLYCATPVVAWVAPKAMLLQYLNRVPTPVYQDICASFESNMASIYKVRPAQLASTILFQDWDLPTLEEVVAQLQLVLFPEHSAILEAGAAGTAVYIVAKGRCRVVSSGPTEELTAGALLGLRACVFLEPNAHEVRACTTVQAWRLPKAALTDFLLRRPDRFLAAKRRLNADLARTLARPPPEELFADSPFAALPHAAQQRLCDRLRPAVVAAMDPVVEQGEAMDDLWFIVRGRCCGAGGAELTPPALRCLGLALPAGRWPHTVTALQRVEGWRLALRDAAAVLAAQKGAARHRATKALLAEVTHALASPGPLAPVGPHRA